LPEFTCQSCAKTFNVSDEALARFPGWVPKKCYRCRKGEAGSAGATSSKTGARPTRPNPSASRSSKATSASMTRELDLPIAEVLSRFHDGPKTGVFTDGAANPNPGPGGWGAVWVIDDAIQGERDGHEPHTTNNRMELLALRAGIALVPVRTAAVIYTDSQLCVNTFTSWAKTWKARGWKRKDGEIKNLELVREIYEQLLVRPELKLQWIAAHSGYRWNEYADALATAYRRSER
jgi:ribonuclease HI